MLFVRGFYLDPLRQFCAPRHSLSLIVPYSLTFTYYVFTLSYEYSGNAMPFWGLVVTSAGFFIPCIAAFRRRAFRHSALSGVLAVTSLFYHGTLHPLAHRVDRFYAHSVGILHTLDIVSAPRLQKIIMLGTPVYLYFTKSLKTEGTESCFWHMAVHVTSVIAWTVEISRMNVGKE